MIVGVDIHKEFVCMAWKKDQAPGDKRGRERWQIFSCGAFDAASIRKLIKRAMSHGASGVAIERPYLDKNVGTHFELSQTYGSVRAAAEEVGLPWEGVVPSVWQNAMLSLRGAGNMKRKDLEKLSKIVAESLGAITCDAHGDDAVCISEFATKMAMFHVKQSTGKCK